MDLPAPSLSGSRSFRSPYRRRRILWATALVFTLGFLFFAPQSFWELNHVQSITESSRSWFPSRLGSSGGWKPLKSTSYGPEDELRDLLHMVASSELRVPREVDATRPLSRDVYRSVELGDVAWLQAVQADPPVIVFSKTYCPYSKKAKELLESLDLSPAPRIVEVDLRDDADQLKVLLTRLTSHQTFPNIFIAGTSIGGSDDLDRLHKNGELLVRLTDAGVSSGAQGST